MLREARIVMPFAGDRLVATKVHDKLQRQFCEAFGGYTKFAGSGGWVNSRGELLNDTNIIYDVAVDSDRDAPWELIARFAIEAGTALDQKSVYVRYPNGEVDIINIVKVDEGFDRFVDVGDGRAALGTKHLPQPGESWQTRAGARVWVGRRATVIDGGWYVTVVDPGPTHEKMMFEYVVNHDGKLIPALPGHDSPRDLVKRIH